jgi:glucose/mannose-6-phosphate isomerase
MGGSTLGPHFIRSVFDVSLPCQIVNDYELPSFVDENTLAVVSSYSGTTEETVSALKDAVAKKAKIIGIASGGTLIDNLRKAGLPFYRFDTKYNPSGQPRMGLGYSIGGILGFLVQLGFTHFSNNDIEKALAVINQTSDLFDVKSNSERNPAKRFAENLVGRIPIIVAGTFLAGNAHIFANQINENAKTFSAYFLLSEMNHHLLEGILNPKSLGEKIKFVFLETPLYSKRIQARIDITKEVLSKAGIEPLSYNIKSGNKAGAAFESLVFSSWTSFYLSIAYGIDPSPIPNVDYFKEQLAKLT